MSNGEDEASPTDAENGSDADEITEESLTARLDDAEGALDAAETEADLDEIETDLDGIEADLEEAALPEPDDDEEEPPADALGNRLESLRSDLDAQRGPYADDVVDAIETARSTISDTQWTEAGETDVTTAVTAFGEAVENALDVDFDASAGSLAGTDDVLVDATESIDAAGLDPDADADTIEALTEAADDLESGLDDAEEWDDLETREQLYAQGYYDVLGHYKDYPPEWSALKEHETRGNVDMVLLALESLQSEFMERHALEALERMGKRAATEDAIDTMLQRASKRDKPAIRILGKMQAEEAVETLIEYVDSDSDPALQKVT
ncbi:MAG: HEAT repeat domain-containing protein, partial [Halobacteriota archaeon]